MEKDVLIDENDPNIKKVLEYFDTSIANEVCSVNLRYEPYSKALEELIKKDYIKEVKYKNLFVGYEYKGYLVRVEAGSSDCEELLVTIKIPELC